MYPPSNFSFFKNLAEYLELQTNIFTNGKQILLFFPPTGKYKRISITETGIHVLLLRLESTLSATFYINPLCNIMHFK